MRELDDEIDVLAGAPYFAVYPSGLRSVSDEMRRIRGRRSSTPTAEDAIIDNARLLLERLEDARRELDDADNARLLRHVDDRLDAIAPRDGAAG
jgi:hypothetical protein